MVDLYSVERIDNNGLPETNEFEKFCVQLTSNGGRDKRQLEEVEAIIQEIADIEGATDSMFRNEGLFYALPSHPVKHRFWDSDGINHFGIRLYCVIASTEILILLNGCSKTNQNPKKCNNCKNVFEFSEKFAEVFFDALNVNSIISINGRDFDFEGKELILNLNYEES